MKNHFLILFIVSGNLACAQLSVGLESGVTMSKMRYENTQSNNDRPDGTHIGFFTNTSAQYYTRIGLGFKAAVGFVSSGGAGESWHQGWGSVPDQTERLRCTVNFLSTCFTIRQRVTFLKSYSLFVGAGPRADFYLWHRENQTFFEEFVPQSRVEPVVYGGRLEAGVGKKFNNLYVGLEATMNINFTQLVEAYIPAGNAAGYWSHQVWLNYNYFGFSAAYTLSGNKSSEDKPALN